MTSDNIKFAIFFAAMALFAHFAYDNKLVFEYFGIMTVLGGMWSLIFNGVTPLCTIQVRHWTPISQAGAMAGVWMLFAALSYGVIRLVHLFIQHN